MRRLVFCFDGSWNGLKATNKPTNVQLLAEAVKPVDADDGTVQIVYYDEGVGTRSDEVWRGGALGQGLLENLREAYRFLIFNHEAGDEIFCFGFSRGGFTAMAFVGLIRSIGILPTSAANKIDEGIRKYRESAVDDGIDSERLRDFRAINCPQYCVNAAEIDWRRSKVASFDENLASIIEIKYLGVWDAVGSIGFGVVKAAISNETEQFYNKYFTSLDAIVQSGRHAVSIDERRKVFKPTLWRGLDDLNRGFAPDTFDDRRQFQQKWFPGDHGSVGGGGEYDGLSRGALQWILEGAALEGLAIDVIGRSQLSKIRYEIDAPLYNSHLSWFGKAKAWLKGLVLSADRGSPATIHDLSFPARRRWSSNPGYRPTNLKKLEDEIRADAVRFVPKPIPENVGYIEYLVVEGDELGEIAKTAFGEAKHWKMLFEVNRDRLDTPNYISPGEKIRLPNAVFDFEV